MLAPLVTAGRVNGRGAQCLSLYCGTALTPCALPEFSYSISVIILCDNGLEDTQIWQNQDLDSEGNGNPLQYSYLENPMVRGAWQATVHGFVRVGRDLATTPPHTLNLYSAVCELSPGKNRLLEQQLV